MKMSFPKVLVAMGILWLALLWLCPAASQSHVFYQGGIEAFRDYRFPRICAASANVYEPEGISRMDAPYPALGYVIAGLFPQDVFRGGLLFTAVSVLALLLGAWLASRDGWLTAAVVLMAPVLHAIGVGNQILLATGGVLVFQAWKDEGGWKKSAAFLALAFATALKIVPCVFGLLLLKERRWRDFALLSIFCALLLFVPFVWAGGSDAFAAFVQNLHLHSDFYGIRSRYGFVVFDRNIRLLLGQGVECVRQTFVVDRILNVVVGAMCLYRWWRTSDRMTEWMMLAAVVLFVPAVTQFYSLMYLLPVLMFGKGLGRVELILSCVALCPLQLPILHGGANMLLSNLALGCLVIGRSLRFGEKS